MTLTKAIAVVGLAATLLAVPRTSEAITACDNFGQDWTISLGAFGGSFPMTLVVSGTRDTNGSLGCGGPLPLDGTSSIVGGLGGLPISLVWSMTAYKPTGSCVSTHWNGAQPFVPPSAVITGTVSNEFGPFGAMTITLGCVSSPAAASAQDPSRD